MCELRAIIIVYQDSRVSALSTSLVASGKKVTEWAGLKLFLTSGDTYVKG
jgi:hypothetical protein